MAIKILCKITEQGTHSFFLKKDRTDYYLFSQNYRKGVHKYYARSVPFNEAIDFSRSKHDSAILRTMEKIKTHTKYIEKQYNIVICQKSQRRRNVRPFDFTDHFYA